MWRQGLTWIRRRRNCRKYNRLGNTKEERYMKAERSLPIPNKHTAIQKNRMQSFVRMLVEMHTGREKEMVFRQRSQYSTYRRWEAARRNATRSQYWYARRRRLEEVTRTTIHEQATVVPNPEAPGRQATSRTLRAAWNLSSPLPPRSGKQHVNTRAFLLPQQE